MEDVCRLLRASNSLRHCFALAITLTATILPACGFDIAWLPMVLVLVLVALVVLMVATPVLVALIPRMWPAAPVPGTWRPLTRSMPTLMAGDSYSPALLATPPSPPPLSLRLLPPPVLLLLLPLCSGWMQEVFGGKVFKPTSRHRKTADVVDLYIGTNG